MSDGIEQDRIGIDSFNEAEGEEALSKDLGVVAELANEMSFLQGKIDTAEEDLKVLKKKCSAISQGSLPEAMMEIGMEKFTMEDGTSLSLDTFYSAKIPDAHQLEAFAWLEANQLDGIIKSNVTVKFGKGDDEKRVEDALCGYLDRNSVPYDNKRGVHHSTLKAFVRERIEGGLEFPQTLFGVFVGQQVKLKRG